VFEQGQGNPVVLIHGLGTGLGDMRASGLVSRLGHQFRVIAVDRPGYGHSHRPRDRVWGVHEQARAIREALAGMGVQRPVVLGHSFGTMVALAWALDAPETVAGLVLVSGYLYPTARADLLTLSPPVIPVVGDILRYAVLPWINRMAVPAMYKRMFSPEPVPSRFYEEVPISMVVRPETIRAIGEEAALMIPGADMLSRQYDRLTTPMTVIAGRADAVTDPRYHSERFADEVSGVTCRMLEGVGHMAHFQAIEEIAQAVAIRSGESLRRLSSEPERASGVATAAAT
jgi:pimeloyl-ACP methyl ester carboxylesterase